MSNSQFFTVNYISHCLTQFFKDEVFILIYLNQMSQFLRLIIYLNV